MADNNFYPYQQPEPGLDPTNNDPNYYSPPPKKNRLLIIIIVAIVFLIIILAVALVVGASSKKEELKQTQQTEQIDPFQKVKISADNIFVNNKQFNFSFMAPYNWRSQAITNIKIVYPWENATPVVGFGFLASGLGQITDITAENQMILRDISEWLDIDQSSSNKSLTPSNKKLQFALLEKFSTNQSLSSDEIKKVINFQTLGLETTGRIKPYSITSEDDSLKGVVYLTILGPDYYDPRAIVLMSGKVNDKNLYLYGDFVIRDETYKKLSTKEAANNKNWSQDTKRAITDFTAGNLAQDTIKIYDELREVIKTIKIESVNPK